ncbi:MAG: tetratricopeptide repeat protein [Phycisphaerales bacterium]|nr:tetratricopeptide repeat protein [Phycisphaerales bacterium]
MAAVQASIDIPGYAVHYEIHRGGQGIVYHATQESTGRSVAIKVLLHGSVSTPRQRARFEREVDLAARIHHPHVVSILDRGVTRDGRGFFAMEYIEGKALDEYLACQHLTVDRVLALFLSICKGVQAAHQRGVLHRDLKPGNVLVSPSGHATVLDFGLAKSEIDQAATMSRTVAGEFMGTLAYAAPEQLAGDPDQIDVRTDVYALGVILYEMLTKRLPHDTSGGVESTIRSVRESEPQRPSKIVKIDPDLSTIVMHALEKLPDRRYQSVDAMTSDINRFLQSKPIMARDPSAVYQLRKFVRRHHAGVAVGCVAILGVFGVVAALSVGVLRTNAALQVAEQRRIEADTELEKQQSVTDFFEELLSEVDPGMSGPDMRVIDLLDVAANRAPERFAEFADLRGGIQSTLGETYTRLGAYAQAETQLRSSIEALQNQQEGKPEQIAGAMCVLAHVLSSTQRFSESEAMLDEADAIAESIHADPGANFLHAQLTHQRGILLHDQGMHAESLAHYQRAIALLDSDESESAGRLRGQILIGMGVNAKRLERFEDALSHYAQAERILLRYRSENHPDLLACLSNRAEILVDLGKWDEAESLQRDLLDRRIAVFGPDHERVGITLNNLGDLLRERGKLDESSEMFSRAIEIFRVSPGDPSMRLAMVLHNAGALHIARKHPETALPLIHEAVSMAGSLLPKEHWVLASFRIKLAECYLALGRTEEARGELNIARPALVAALGESHSRVLRADELLAQAANAEAD